MRMYPIVLNLEVQNSFEYPKQTQMLAEEIGDMSARIEDTTEFEERDVFLSSAFETGLEVVKDNLDLYAKWVADLSREFPDLVLAMDATEGEGVYEGSIGGDIVFRWYFRDGRRQVAEPYMVVPDFDPDEAGEEIK